VFENIIIFENTLMAECEGNGHSNQWNIAVTVKCRGLWRQRSGQYHKLKPYNNAGWWRFKIQLRRIDDWEKNDLL